MIKFEIPDSDLQRCKKHWIELRKLFTKPDDLTKADFIDKTLFKSSGLNDSTATKTVSLNTMTDIMTEIDNELKENSNNNNNNNDIDIKTKDITTKETTEDISIMDENVKEFIRKPV